jgi:hypothetical protein
MDAHADRSPLRYIIAARIGKIILPGQDFAAQAELLSWLSAGRWFPPNFRLLSFIQQKPVIVD